MKCKYCGAKGIKISHFMRKHKALMLRKMHRGKRGGGRRARRSGGGGRGHSLNIPRDATRLTITFHER